MSDDVEIIYQDKEGKCIIVKMVIGGENVFLCNVMHQTQRWKIYIFFII